MFFYPFSIISIVPLGIAYCFLGFVYWRIPATAGKGGNKALTRTAIGALFLVLPFSEELWIAWNFNQACKEAGTVIHRKVRVEGFYDDTTHWWRQLAESDYQYVESRDGLAGTLWRVERVGNEIWHFRIDRPTARYWYAMDKGRKLAHKVDRQQSTVTDKKLDVTIAMYARISREAPWYFVGLAKPNMGCDGPEGGPRSKQSFLVYRDVLLSAGSTSGSGK